MLKILVMRLSSLEGQMLEVEDAAPGKAPYSTHVTSDRVVVLYEAAGPVVLPVPAGPAKRVKKK